MAAVIIALLLMLVVAVVRALLLIMPLAGMAEATGDCFTVTVVFCGSARTTPRMRHPRRRIL